jgi:predicted nucleic acid-binding protein
MEFLENSSLERFRWILDSELVAPSLLKYEYNNVFLSNRRLGDFVVVKCRRIVSLLLLEYVSIDDEEEEIFSIANDNNLTFYDASYLHIAVKRRIPIASYDAQIIRAAKNFSVEVIP